MTMSQRAALALFLTGISLAPGPASAAQCRDETEPLQGTLRFARMRHALNSSPIEAWQLVFKQPICVLYKESVNQKDKTRLDGVGAMHLLVTPSEAARLKGRSGARVTVKAGTAGGVSPPLTAWHIGDAIMVHPEIVSVGGKPFR
jgi:hypothetical protein